MSSCYSDSQIHFSDRTAKFVCLFFFRYLLRLCSPRDGGPTSPLPAGANDGDDVMPQYLDVNGRNAAGATPLELAASQGHLEVVR